MGKKKKNTSVSALLPEKCSPSAPHNCTGCCHQMNNRVYCKSIHIITQHRKTADVDINVHLYSEWLYSNTTHMNNQFLHFMRQNIFPHRSLDDSRLFSKHTNKWFIAKCDSFIHHLSADIILKSTIKLKLSSTARQI